MRVKKGLSAAIALLLFVAGTGPAFAHVTVTAPGAVQGGYAVLTFRVPNEEASASTTELVVHLPVPIASVLVQPHPGWTATVAKAGSGDVTEIDWRADDAASAIAPGQFDQFLVSAGPLPKVSTLAFAAIQTYSDGTVVSWNETAAPGSAEPAHPKPTLTLAPAGKPATAATSASSSGGGSGATILAAVALVLAAAALGLAVVTRVRVGGR
ncbi:MAG: DUF1775 domain-containing protein [Jatrophihabitans sp.]|nr:MAG: DUF1775 domain-containing protein [Jatrophihabitans sp.]